ncbi:MAG: hypothetical protein UZ22_OP11002000753 [Microgenomates bacterium OLB23]|nr:MAG: hypothetical protein UZ22_OP11002000753 [Microgenomates bacterium OLB23]
MLPQSAYAKEGSRREAAKEKVQDRMEERKEERDNRREDSCERLKERLASKETNFDNSHKFHIRQYQRIKEKIAKVIRDANSAGKNTTQLTANLETLNEKIEKFDADRTALINALKVVQMRACAEDKEDFKEKLEEAQALHKTVLADVKDIKSYYQNTIRPSLKALKD